MEHKRKFIIKVSIDNLKSYYIKKIYRNSIGYWYIRTTKIEKSKIWKFKKNCQNTIDRIQKNIDTTKLKNFKDDILEIIEITDNKTLRNIKLKKLNKK